MKLKFNKLFVLINTLLLTSCGFASDDLYKGNVYNSPVFSENYYTKWDNNLLSFKDKIGSKCEVEKVFTNYQEFLKTGIDEEAAKWDYFWLPKYPSMYNPNDYYSYYRKMNGVDNSFNYGYLSKLYDGQMFCGGDYQLSRVQINEDGFAQYFKKEARAPKYFAMNFKASIDFTNTTLLNKIYESDPSIFPSENNYYHKSSCDMVISFYTKDSGSIKQYSYLYSLSDINTNHYETYFGSEYNFFGFSLENIPENLRIVGYSIQFKVHDQACDLAQEKFKEKLDYSLMVYEVMMPFATWH